MLGMVTPKIIVNVDPDLLKEVYFVILVENEGGKKNEL